ncbi:MAG TPA: MFS transporter [Pyrinomonadaceae bacterium]|nr:MFS transporter [Pyrinomonadaceae bacterium]
MDSQQPHVPSHPTPDPVPHEIAPPPAAVDERGGPARALTIDFSPLKVSREFRLLFIGQSISFFGTMMSLVVLPWQTYQLTKSSLAVGMLGVAEFVPILVMAFVGGALADYVDRRRMVRLTELLLAVGSIVLIINSLLPEPRVWVLFVCAASFAALNGLQRPSLEALAPRLVAPELLPAASALTSLGRTVGAVAAPALGGLLAAAIGAALAYSIDLVTFVVSLVALWLMRSVPPPPDADRPSLRSVVEGLRFARSRPELMGTYLIDINAMFFGMPMALFPAVATNFGGASVGLLYSAPATGAMLATLTSGWIGRVHRHGLAVVIAAAVWGLAIIGFGLAGRLWLALLCLVLAGAADMLSGLFRMTIWNQTIPDHLRGRLAGIEMVSYTTGPLLGNAESGLVASYFGIRTSILSGGILCVVGTGLLALALPAFVRYDARAGLARKQAEDAARIAEASGQPIEKQPIEK